MEQQNGKRKANGFEPDAPKRSFRPPGDEDEDMLPDSIDLEEVPEDTYDVDLEEVILREAELEAGGATTADERLKRWSRPPVAEIDPGTTSTAFQQLEIDYVVGQSPSWMGVRRGKNAILRIFGVTAEGHSVCALVHGFQPYFYVQAPPHFSPDDIYAFRASLEERTKSSMTGQGRGAEQFVADVEMVQKQTMMYYQLARKSTFLKITTVLPTHVTACRGVLEKGSFSFGTFPPQAYTTYESNVLFVLRFMIDNNIGGGNWIELQAGKYRRGESGRPITHCQLEFDIRHRDLISHPATGQWGKMAPFRILSFDIECQGRKGRFPEPEHDPVIQIANLVTLQGESKPFVRNVMTLDTCAPIVGAEVLAYDNEQSLLKAWQELIQTVDPDVIIGYNICKFDLPYLIERADVLKVATFKLLGRVRGAFLKMKDSVFSSRQYGTRESKEVTIEGRVQFDLLQAIQRDHKLSSYSLNSVSAHFLNEQKEDVHHSIISDLQGGTAETRRRLAVYCLKDAYLPQRLLDKLKYIFNYVEMARVTGVPLTFLLARGQSIKVLCQILRKARQRNLLVPRSGGHTSAQESYEGATVLEANQGYYEKPVATLDFASLYPSIMMAHNLCYCTLVPRDVLPQMRLSPDDYYRTPTGDVFVKSHLCKGILAEILEELLAARKTAKMDLKVATDPFERAVLDGRQMALKLTANSVYGFTGATVGALPCLEISSSVTACGREMIEKTKGEVEKRYNVANGYKHKAEVIYGDTDSVMVKFGVDTVEEAMKLGREAAQLITQTFPPPIKLEFEKVYFPYLLISKKRYAGLLWTNPEAHDKMDTKGIETVRRDNCLLVKNVITEVLRRLLVERDIPGATGYVKGVIADLLMNRMDLSLLVITKGLTKGEDEDGKCEACRLHTTSGAPPCPKHYGNKAAHVELALRMRKRDAATAPTLGDRVPYVIIKGSKGAKAYEKSEDPIYVLENNIPIDAQYYLENQLSKPLMRIFEPIMKNAKGELLHGEHTRAVSIVTPTTGGIMKFAQKRLSCLGCRTPISESEQTLCSHCKPREGEIFQKAMASVREVEEQFNRLWTQCQRCQGSLHQDVLCTSRDCPIFYRRRKAQKDLKEAEGQLSRFDF